MRPGDRPPPPPPAYHFLPESTPRSVARPQAPPPHDALRADRLTGVLQLALTTVDAVHIGSGATAMRETQQGLEIAQAMVLMQVGEDRLPVLPGSSLKGAVRSLVEAVTSSCKLEGECRPLCLACGLFGYAYKRDHFAARVGFSDALPRGEVDEGLSRLPSPFSPRIRGGRKIYQPRPGTPLTGRVPYEVIAAGQSFFCELQVVNLTEAELGLVLLCLGFSGPSAPRFCLRVGGGKFAGLGRVRCDVPRLSLRRGYQSPLPEVVTGPAAAQRVEALVGAFTPDETGQRVLALVREQLPDPADPMRAQGGAR